MPSFDLSRSPLLTTVHDVLGELRDAAWDERDKGDRFERLIASYLRTDPLYAQKYDEVWRWSDWLGREARPDTGIDLVARERETGELCAIQCKFYDASRTLEKGEIDSFFSLDDALAQILQEIELRRDLPKTLAWKQNGLGSSTNVNGKPPWSMPR